MSSRFPSSATLLSWFRALRLAPRRGALIGGGAGALVGLAMTVTMLGHQVFTQRFQEPVAGALLVVVWTAIGIVSGLTVLSPDAPEGDGVAPAGRPRA